MNKTTKSGLDFVFGAQSIAVVGASSSATKTGGRPIHLLRKHGYAGKVFPVNPTADEIQGLPAYASIDALPEVPDLVMIAVPGAAAVAALEAAATRGVGAAIVLSAGFAEAGAEGVRLQKRVTEIAQTTGMRIIGPNCLGAVSVKNRVIGTFSVALENEMPRDGGVSIASQSGNIGSAALRMLGDNGAGAARFIATGNEADVEVSDAISWLVDDPETKVILCILETCRDATRLKQSFAKAQQAGKPVIALKIGTSEVGQLAALSHTGGLAGSDRVYDAVFDCYGVQRAHSLEELVQIGSAVEAIGTRRMKQPVSAAIIAASGGFGVMLADAAAANNVAINPLSQATQDRIHKVLPLAATANPIDATAQMSANPDVMEDLVEAALSDPANSTVCLMLALGMEIPRLRNVFMDALEKVTKRHPNKTLVACVPGPAEAIRGLRALGIACFPTIDAAMAGVAALGRLDSRHDLKAKPADLLVQKTPLNPQAWRNEATAKAALGAAGLLFCKEIVATNQAEAEAAANEIAGPMAMKILSSDIQHKSDIGGVKLNVSGAEAAKAAFVCIETAARLSVPDAVIDGVLMSPMTDGGSELILGTTTDPTFGPVVMVGLGGIFAEIFEDTALRLAPIDEATAGAMLRELKAFPLLDGARGRAPADTAAVIQAIVALSQFAVRHADDVAEIDINPLVAHAKGQGAVALDALIIPHQKTQREHAE